MMCAMLLVETFRCLWSLFLAFFRSKPEKHMSTAVLPLSSEKMRAVGKPEFLSPHQRVPIQRRGSHHPISYARSNPHPSKGHLQSQGGFSTYSLILPDRHSGPPPRPPRPRSPVSGDDFRTPKTSDVHLPSVIVTPCTPSKASRTYIGINQPDELDSSDESSGSDANSCITSVDSNPFLSDPSSPLQKGTRLPPSAHHRARSLTRTGLGLYHQRPSLSDYSTRGHQLLHFSVADTGMLTNPVKKSDSVGPITSSTSFIRSLATNDQRIRSYMTTKSARQMLVPVASTRHSEDSKGGVIASRMAQPAILACKDATVIESVHGHAQPSVAPYSEVFDLDAYFDSDSSLPSESTLNTSCSTTDSTESNDPFLIPATSPSSTSILRSPLRRISNISDTTASSTSIYTYSLSAMSTDTDGSSSSHSPRFGSLRIADNGSKSKVTFDHEVKRYRDHYRPPAYSRSPAFVIESPTTSRKFTGLGRRDSDGLSIKNANKENEMAGLATSIVSSTSTLSRAKLSDTDSMSPRIENPSHAGDTSTTELPSNTPLQELQRPFRTSSSSTITASLSLAGNSIATRHRLGSVAISQRRKM